MARKVRQYTDKFKADALALLYSSGYPEKYGVLPGIAKHLKMPQQTLSDWAAARTPQPPVELVIDSVNRLREVVTEELGSIFAAMKTKRDEASYRDLTIAAGIFIDKYQLLDGQPTENVKQQITFERTGITTLPEHLAPRTVEGAIGEEEI